MGKYKSIFSTILKIALFFLLFSTIYFQLKQREIAWFDFVALWQKSVQQNIVFLFFAVLLAPINWLCEILKWKYLVQIVQVKFSIKKALVSVLSGVFLGFVTPNRVGEFGGRLFAIKKGNRTKAFSLSVWGGVAQSISTIFFGLLSAMYFFGFQQYQKMMLPTIALLLVFILVYFYFARIVKWGLSFFQKYFSQYKNFIELSSQNKITVLLWTVLRYTIYIAQYVLIARFFGFDWSILQLMTLFSLLLMLQSILPSFALLDLGIRGNILLFLLKKHPDYQLISLCVILLVWILNLVIPAVVGYFLLTKTKKEETK